MAEEGWRVDLTESAEADLGRLRNRHRNVYRQFRKEIQPGLEADPYAVGKPLQRQLTGQFAVHFWNDKYRTAWSIDDEARVVTVRGVGPKEGFYEQAIDRFREEEEANDEEGKNLATEQQPE